MEQGGLLARGRVSTYFGSIWLACLLCHILLWFFLASLVLSSCQIKIPNPKSLTSAGTQLVLITAQKITPSWAAHSLLAGCSPSAWPGEASTSLTASHCLALALQEIVFPCWSLTNMALVWCISNDSEVWRNWGLLCIPKCICSEILFSTFAESRFHID